MLKTALLLCFILLITHQIIFQPYQSTLQYKGLWGDFGPLIYSSQKFGHSYGCGAQLRYHYTETIKGIKLAFIDNAAAAGLRITFCNPIDWKNQQIQQIPGNNWGTWKGMQMCPEGSYIMGFQVRYQDTQGTGDDTALNGLKIFCRNPYNSWTGIAQTKQVMVYEGMWGNWKPVYQDKIGYLRGFNIQNQNYIKNGDNTCMNGLSFAFQAFSIQNYSSVQFRKQCLSPMQRVSKV